MAKSPRKVSANKTSYSQKLNPKLYKTPRYGGKGGKSFHNYNFQAKRNRRLSIADSISSEGSDEIAGLSRKYSTGSESESSLTAMSEDDETAASRKGSVFFDGESVGPLRLAKLKKTRPPTRPPKHARKKVSTKMYKTQASESSDDDDDNDDDEVEEDDDDNNVAVMDYLVDDNDEEAEGLGAIYSMVDYSRRSSTDLSSSQDSPDVDNDYSSSDDSEVDFVQLQAERRAKSMKSLRAIKGLPKPPAPIEQNKQEKQDKVAKRRKSSTYRRRSEVALPEGINFKFEFDDSSAVINEEDEDALETSKPKSEEEDLGEEVDANGHDYNFDFHFTEPTMDVPKFKDDEFNSEEEYEFDDNDLLATLQADNDIDEFITDVKPEEPRTRQGSLSSMNSLNEDDTEDPFLREEEKYLVNEFEFNGFDDEDDDIVATAKVMDSFKDTNSQKKQVLQYASSSDDSQFGSDLEDETKQTFDEDDGNDYIDLIDFDTPIYDKKPEKLDDHAPIQSQSQKSKKKKHLAKSHKRKGPLDSEDDDDSYLWNYFFSSDADSENESEPETYDLEEQFMLEQIFKQDLNAKNGNLKEFSQDGARESSLEPVESDHEYDSGESTDVDLSLPSSSGNNQAGSKVAKEVLSSKTADYRPPVLGTWVAVDCKPFGIIDGLSTRTLNQTKNPRKGWRNFSIKPDSEDSAIELDELLNISELDNDDENDIRIWRDFNNNKKHVPLGAFRNKLHISHPVVVPEPMAGFSTSKMNTDFNTRKNSQSENRVKKPVQKAVLPTAVKDSPISSKQRRRRQSIADAVSEGYRPTKSGLFSENVLADVEEVLGDDRDFMALIKGL
ncbi:CIC11C00000001586 [Sungouiella intermedia]|uniref:CIC11C00000001586 n=1 Tax=Sungouiella intermedia TaxID=45354 RepID=A0A1L0B9A7_9ASCO|nr:CIC11C00000001586 [[Candida] intermedia]